MSSRRRHQSLARRATAALLVGFWLAGLVGSIFHDASHEHRYCSQHGAFEEAGTVDAKAAPAPADGTSRVRPGDATEQTLQHEACAFADLGVRAPVPTHATIASARPTPPAPATSPPVSHVASPIPLLANAPKAS